MRRKRDADDDDDDDEDEDDDGDDNDDDDDDLGRKDARLGRTWVSWRREFSEGGMKKGRKTLEKETDLENQRSSRKIVGKKIIQRCQNIVPRRIERSKIEINMRKQLPLASI